jgi:hypothetical protein
MITNVALKEVVLAQTVATNLLSTGLIALRAWCALVASYFR